MSTSWIAEEPNPLHNVPANDNLKQPAATRLTAKIISYIFHPVFIPIYIIWFLLYAHPYLFAGFSSWNKTLVMIQAFVMFTFFPVITVLLLKGLKFINSFHLDTQKDRIIPLIACGVWYFWVWYVWRNLPDYPKPAIQLALAIWIAASLGLLANIIMKISLHTMSVGIMVAFMLILGFTQSINLGIYIAIALAIAGLVSTARLLVSDHTQKEIYGGLFLGIFCQLIAFWTT